MNLNFGWMRKLAAAGVLAGALVGLSASGAPVASSGRIWLEGQSTLHAYKTEATSFDIALEGAQGSAVEALRAHAVTGATLKLAVIHLRSGESKLDSNLRDALRTARNPDIVFKAARIDAEPVDGATFPVKLTGVLSVAGVEQPEVIDATGRIENGALRLTGAKALKMTDFRVDPPVLLLGTIRCADAISIHFDVLVK